jgi:hypothetical protein
MILNAPCSRAIDPGLAECPRTVAKAGAGFRSLKDTWADTTTPHGRLMLTVLGGFLADQEDDGSKATEPEKPLIHRV